MFESCHTLWPCHVSCVGLCVTLGRKEIQALHEELEVLSLQHTHRCVENAEMVQELQERRASAQKESQEPGNQEESQEPGNQEVPEGPHR